MPQWYSSLTPELVWGLYTRGLGLIFMISYASLVGQVVDTSGRHGGFPAWRRLAKIKRDFPLWRRWLHFPTLLWLDDSDAMLRALTWIGFAAAGLVVYGGPLSPWALATCYVCYISLDLMVGLIYPWDCLLFEASVLSLFLPATHSLPDLHAIMAPPPALAWASRLLLFRVMFGFGKQKFIGSTGKDMTYLRGFLVGQPLPSPLGWYGQKLPLPFLKAAMVMMVWAELPAPFLAFVPGIPSLICALTMVLLMIGIQATGNFGYFSMLTIVACIPLLDNVTPTHLDLFGLFGPGAPNVTNAFVLLHTLGACLALPFNSWVGQCWHLWGAWYRMPPVLNLPLRFLSLLHPFRWLHPYGVFPPNTGPGIKVSLLIEGSWDNQTWHEFDCDFAFSHPKSRPRFIAPYHPRGDQAVIYETFGLAPTGLGSTTLGPYDPYTFGQFPAANVLAQRVTEGYARDFVNGEAFDQHEGPPVAVRISTVMLEPCSLERHRATGEYWKRTYIGPHMPPRGNDPSLWEEFLPEPELWHFDAITWRRRSKLKHLIAASLAGHEDPMKIALMETDELTTEDVDRFWNELVPFVGTEKRQTFETLPDVVPALRARYDHHQLRALNRMLGRFSMVLVARLEPLYLGRGSKPLIPVPTNFHLWMLAHHIIGNGKDAYLAALADPMSVVNDVSAMTPQTGMYYYSIFRYESMVFDAQKARLLTGMSAPYDAEKKRVLLAGGPENMSKFQRSSDEMARLISGYYIIAPAILESFKGPRFDLGYPERYPSFRELPTGEIEIVPYAEPPAATPAATSSRPAAE